MQSKFGQSKNEEDLTFTEHILYAGIVQELYTFSYFIIHFKNNYNTFLKKTLLRFFIVKQINFQWAEVNCPGSLRL